MQRISWYVGWIVLVAAWCGPLPRWAGSSFSAHMGLHMLLVAVAAPLLSLGLAGWRYDPVGRWPSFFAAIPASIAELIIVWAWHAPTLHHAARHTTLGFAIEQAMFLAIGVWLWLSAFGGTRTAAALAHAGDDASQSLLLQRRGAGVLALLLTSMHMTLLGALLALSPRLLFAHPHTHGGLSPLTDQHVGGAIMLVIGGAAYLLGGVWLMADIMRTGRTLQSTDAL